MAMKKSAARANDTSKAKKISPSPNKAVKAVPSRPAAKAKPGRPPEKRAVNAAPVAASPGPAPTERGVSCYVVWLRCLQNGGCADLAEAFVTTSARDAVGYVASDLDDAQTADMLLFCRPTYEVRVVREGKIDQVIDVYPFLSAKMEGKSYTYAAPDQTRALQDAVEEADADPEEPCWETRLDRRRLEDAMPQLTGTLATKGKVVSFDDPELPERMKWGASDPRVRVDG